MQMVKQNEKNNRLIDVDGLLTVTLEQEIKSTKANFIWKGPHIPAELWNQVLAFLKWTYDTHKGEAQMRLFVNTKTKTWAAWAFPQIRSTGMTTKEMDATSDEWTKQRAQFSDCDGWLLFGTVHHHCGMSAFQSGTDEENEKNQDGLHITVGKMDENKHDIHCRIYISGNCWNPDMSLLYDVDWAIKEIPEWAKTLMVSNAADAIARALMCTPAPDNTAFPDEWKANIKEEPRLVYSSHGGEYMGNRNLIEVGPHTHGVHDPRSKYPIGMTKKQRRALEKEKNKNKANSLNFEYGLRRALEAICDLVDDSDGIYTLDDIVISLDNILNAPYLPEEIMGVCIENSVSPSALRELIQSKLNEAEQMQVQQELKQQQRQLTAEGGPSSNGVSQADSEAAERWHDIHYGL
jgi:hypothetical protein